jgi:hypothetical protein
MRTAPAGSPGRKTVLMRVTVPVYERIANQQSALIQRTRRTNVTLCEALESLLENTEESGDISVTVSITDNKMTSPHTHHYAVPVNKTSWRVTWLPKGTRLTRNQATTAMMIASVVGQADGPDDLELSPVRRHLPAWAAEVGVAVELAIIFAARPRKWEV